MILKVYTILNLTTYICVAAICGLSFLEIYYYNPSFNPLFWSGSLGRWGGAWRLCQAAQATRLGYGLDGMQGLHLSHNHVLQAI